jgi:hypothetical protein
MRLYDRTCDAPPGPLPDPPAPADAELAAELGACESVGSVSFVTAFSSTGRDFAGVGSAFAINVFFGDAVGLAFGVGFAVGFGDARGVGEASGFGVAVDLGVAVGSGVAVGVGIGVGVGVGS